MVNIACDQLQEQLGPGLVADIQERIYVESPFLDPRRVGPDIHVFEKGRAERNRSRGGTAVAEPILLPLELDEYREREIEIRDYAAGGRVVTVIEFVSVGNKTGRIGRKKYRQKQMEVVDAEANLVEVDLVRGGRPVTLAGARPISRRAAYHICIFRTTRGNRIEFYPVSMREPLPTINIPLRPTDDDIVLNLAAVLEETYRKGRYDEILDYDEPPDPPLRDEDAKWAKKLIGAWRKKQK